MTWHWSAAVGFALASCGGNGRAVPTEVEIEWPDAATTPQALDAAGVPQSADAGTGPEVEAPTPAMDPAAPPSE
jgi:hypothetical protein